jgi:D-alanyl-D-alanine carboxypeptidase/D-alanyl-D-alanine-endopeptidase (penicillin-binding protein 4)
MRPHARITAVLAVCAALLFVVPAGAGAATFERAGSTPVARSAQATAAGGLSMGALRAKLRGLMRGAGKGSGAWVADVPASGGFKRLYGARAGKRRKLASNMKLFATSTALLKFGPAERLETTAWNTGTLLGGQIAGDLVLRGGGDPALSPTGINTLAARVRAAGVTSVTGRVVYDESFFDGARGVPTTGVSGGLGAPLSGLFYPGGPKKAAQDFVAALKARGIALNADTRAGTLPRATSKEIASYGSPTIAQLAADTNIPSNNFLAELLVKAIGAEYGASGSTAAGLNVIKPLWAKRGAPVKAENGSGLSVRDRATPKAVGRLLIGMLQEEPATTQAWTESLAVAGVSGTLASRMRGTAAANRCRGKTGTINGVSALSGYCFASGHTVVFSFLMSKISDARAHQIQDKMTAIVSRYG